MVLLARIYYPEGYNRSWFCPREFTTLKGISRSIDNAKGALQDNSLTVVTDHYLELSFIYINHAFSTFCRARHCPKTRSGFERLFFRLIASGSIDDRANIACFAVFVRRKNARSRANDGVFRQSLRYCISSCYTKPVVVGYVRQSRIQLKCQL